MGFSLHGHNNNEQYLYGLSTKNKDTIKVINIYFYTYLNCKNG